MSMFDNSPKAALGFATKAVETLTETATSTFPSDDGRDPGAAAADSLKSLALSPVSSGLKDSLSGSVADLAKGLV